MSKTEISGSREYFESLYNILLDKLETENQSIINLIINENIHILTVNAKHIQHMRSNVITERYQKFLEKRDQILRYRAVKEDGKIVVDADGNYVFPNEEECQIFKDEYGKLEEQYKADIEEVAKNNKKLEEFLAEPIELPIYKVYYKHLESVILTHKEYTFFVNNFCTTEYKDIVARYRVRSYD